MRNGGSVRVNEWVVLLLLVLLLLLLLLVLLVILLFRVELACFVFFSSVGSDEGIAISCGGANACAELKTAGIDEEFCAEKFVCEEIVLEKGGNEGRYNGEGRREEEAVAAEPENASAYIGKRVLWWISSSGHTSTVRMNAGRNGIKDDSKRG